MRAGRKIVFTNSFYKNRTDTAEMKYKAYRNKLTSILRYCDKNYYINLLEQEKNNVKGTWKILNTIILALRLELVIAYQVSADYSSASVTV